MTDRELEAGSRDQDGAGVDADERERRRRVFSRIADFERGCELGTQVRSLVSGEEKEPCGVAWVPEGLPAVPKLDKSRVVEMQGPGGQSLLYVPFFELLSALRQAAADQEVPEEELRALASLEPGSLEIAIYGLFELIQRLASPRPGD